MSGKLVNQQLCYGSLVPGCSRSPSPKPLHTMVYREAEGSSEWRSGPNSTTKFALLFASNVIMVLSCAPIVGCTQGHVLYM